MSLIRRVFRAIGIRIKYRFRLLSYYAFIRACFGCKVRYRGHFSIQRKIIEEVITLREKYLAITTAKKVRTVSVVIPHFDQQEFLSQTIRCILDQTFQACEIVVVDDLSTDLTSVKKIENDFKSISRVRFLYATEKLYAGGARQKGCDAAIGDAVLFIDSDDLMHSHRLEHSVKFMNQHDDCMFLVSGYIPFINSPPEEEILDYKIIESHAILPYKLTKRLAKNFAVMRLSWINPDEGKVPWYAWGSFGCESRYPAANGSILIRRDLASVLKWSNPKKHVFTPYEDYEYCLLAHAVTTGGYQLDAPLLYYRKGSTTNNPANMA